MNAVPPSSSRFQKTVTRSMRVTMRNSAWWLCHMIPMTATLRAYEMRLGHWESKPCARSASEVFLTRGTTKPSASSVNAKAKTPSEKPSNRALCIRKHRLALDGEIHGGCDKALVVRSMVEFDRLFRFRGVLDL